MGSLWPACRNPQIPKYRYYLEMVRVPHIRYVIQVQTACAPGACARTAASACRRAGAACAAVRAAPTSSRPCAAPMASRTATAASCSWKRAATAATCKCCTTGLVVSALHSLSLTALVDPMDETREDDCSVFALRVLFVFFRT